MIIEILADLAFAHITEMEALAAIKAELTAKLPNDNIKTILAKIKNKIVPFGADGCNAIKVSDAIREILKYQTQVKQIIEEA